MKTSIQFFSVAVLLFFFQSSFAQVRVSPKVGLNVSAIEGNLKDFRAEARAGWQAGIDFRIGEGVLFLNPGLYYYSYTARLMQDLDENANIDFTILMLRSVRT